MKKIPTLFVRDELDRHYVTAKVTPGCEWVLAGEGVATRKYDGTCCMFDGSEWWARREAKDGGRWPEQFQALNRDSVTGKTVGWQPMRFSSFAKWHAEAVDGIDACDGAMQPGTYELCGPKVNGNPEDLSVHIVIRHALAEPVTWPRTASFAAAKALMLACAANGWEGVVWHHSDGRMAKLKARDFPAQGASA